MNSGYTRSGQTITPTGTGPTTDRRAHVPIDGRDGWTWTDGAGGRIVVHDPDGRPVADLKPAAGCGWTAQVGETRRGIVGSFKEALVQLVDAATKADR